MGANLATINLTPSELRGDYLLYKRDRFIMTEERILQAIEEEGLVPSKRSLADFYRSRKLNGAAKPQPLPGAAARLSCKDSLHQRTDERKAASRAGAGLADY